MLGYVSMGMYTGLGDHVKVKKTFGTEIVHIDQYSLIAHLNEATAEDIAAEKQALKEQWDVAVHDCCNMTKFARGLNQTLKEGKWFGANNFGCEFGQVPFEAFLPILEDESFQFLEEEPMPEEYLLGAYF